MTWPFPRRTCRWCGREFRWAWFVIDRVNNRNVCSSECQVAQVNWESGRP